MFGLFQYEDLQGYKRLLIGRYKKAICPYRLIELVEREMPNFTRMVKVAKDKAILIYSHCLQLTSWKRNSIYWEWQ